MIFKLQWKQMPIIKRAIISVLSGLVASMIFCGVGALETVLFPFAIIPFAIPSLVVLFVAEYGDSLRPIVCLLLYLATTIPFTAWMVYVWLIQGLEGGPMAKFMLQNYIIIIVAMYVPTRIRNQNGSPS